MPTQYELETLVTRLMAETKDLRRGLAQAERLIQNTAKVASEHSRQISSSLGGIGQTALSVGASLLGLSSIMSAGFQGIKLAAEAETLATTFRVLVGDAELAKKTLQDLEAFALSTPFEMPELVGSAKQMIAFGEEAQNIVPTMRRLGDVSSGLAIPLRDLTYLYGTLKSQGRAFTIDIRQFAMRGIPIYLELAKVLGLVEKSAKKVGPEIREAMNKMISEGAVNFDMVEQAFKNMTDKGGQFFNLMEERSKTLEGLFNEMKESIALSLREIGRNLIEGLQLHVVVRQVTELTAEFNKWLKGLSADTKKAILLVIALIGVMITLTAVIALAGALFNIFTGGFPILIGAITTAIGLTAVWAESVGGLQKAWKIVKRAAQDFWNFIKPILPALAALLVVASGPLGIWIVVLGAIVAYWDDVKKAAKAFIEFISPSLRALWSLIKTVGFAIRDGLVMAWDHVVRVAKQAVDAIAGLLGSITGGNIDWNKIKYGIRDFILFVEYAFTHMQRVSILAWDMIKYAAIVTADEMIKHLFIVPVAIIGAFIGLAKGLKQLFEQVLVNLVKGVGAAAKAIWEAIKSGEIGDLADKVKKEFQGMVVDGVLATEELRKEIEKRVGKVSFNELEVDGVKIPVGLNVEGLQKERQTALEAVKIGMQGVGQEFDKFKADKLLQFQFEDAFDTFQEMWNDLVLPFLFPRGEAQAFGMEAGKSFGGMLDKEAKKFDGVLKNSAEGMGRMMEFKERLPVINRSMQVQQSTVMNQVRLPNEAEKESVDWLKRIHEVLEREARQPNITVNPFDLP